MRVPDAIVVGFKILAEGPQCFGLVFGPTVELAGKRMRNSFYFNMVLEG